MIVNRIILLSEWLHSGRSWWYKSLVFGGVLSLLFSLIFAGWAFVQPADFFLIVSQAVLVAGSLVLMKRLLPQESTLVPTVVLALLATVPIGFALWEEYQALSLLSFIVILGTALVSVWIFNLKLQGASPVKKRVVQPKQEKKQKVSAPKPAISQGTNGKLQGNIAWFNRRKGYGFIKQQQTGDKDVFVHQNSVIGGDVSNLKKGAPVAYVLENDERGLRATEVAVVSE